MANDISGMGDIHSIELARLTRGGIVLSSLDDLGGLDDAFSEWDEEAPIAQLARGSQAHVLPVSTRAATLADPATTAMLARATRRAAVPTALEQAILALTNGVPELVLSDC
jgi:hypothetical protein